MTPKALLLILTFALSFLASAQTLPDPTKPKSVISEGGVGADGLDAQGFPSVLVSAVFLKNNSRIAIVNGNSLKVGDLLNGTEVVDIHKNGIVLRKADQKKEFLINNTQFLKDASNDF